MSYHRRTQTRGNLVRHSKVSFMNSVAFLEPLALEWIPNKYAVAPIPGYAADGDETGHHTVGEGNVLHHQLLADEGDGEEAVPRSTFRQKLYHTLNGRVDSPIEYFILLMIFLNVIMFMTSTVWVDRKTGEISCITLEEDDEDKCIQLGDKYSGYFDTFEIFSMGVFTIEYLIRLYVCVEDPKYYQQHWFLARLRWMFTLFALIDLAAIIPTWVEVLVPAINCAGFGILRICRLGRLIKAQDYIDAFGVLKDVVQQNSALLVISCWYGFLALVFFSSILYYTERNWDGDSGVVFASIPKGMFATTLFLTGEFTLDELSPAGEFFSLVACLGTIGMITIPVSVLAAGFIENIQSENLRKKYLLHKRSSALFSNQNSLHPDMSKSWRNHSFDVGTEADDKTDGRTPKHESDYNSPNSQLTLEKLVIVESKLDRLLQMESTIERLETVETKIDEISRCIKRAIPIE